MRTARLEMALESGLFVLPPAGDILVLRPRSGDDLSGLPKDRVVVHTGFRPDYDHFSALGFRMGASGVAAAAILCLPRARVDALNLIAQGVAMVAPGAPVLLDGQKLDGIDSAIRTCRMAGLPMGEVLAKAHGKAVVLCAAPTPEGWIAAPQMVTNGYVTRPFCFSADGPDPGSALLATALPARLPPYVADLGAGWGFLGGAILDRDGVQTLDLIEAEVEALHCARENLADPRVHFHWVDATAFKPARPWDAVVMNPPFHNGRAPEPELGIAFIRAAHRNLALAGTLWLVANRHLPYDPVLTTLFREVTDIGGNAVYRLTRAAFPLRIR